MIMFLHLLHHVLIKPNSFASLEEDVVKVSRVDITKLIPHGVQLLLDDHSLYHVFITVVMDRGYLDEIPWLQVYLWFTTVLRIHSNINLQDLHRLITGINLVIYKYSLKPALIYFSRILMLKLDQIDVSASGSAILCLEKGKALFSGVAVILKFNIAYQFTRIQI